MARDSDDQALLPMTAPIPSASPLPVIASDGGGSPIEGDARSNICPFLRRVDSTGQLDMPAERPHPENSCAALGVPQPQTLDIQAALCLTSAHVDCPRYLQAAPASRATQPSSLSRAVVAALMILVASIAASTTFVVAHGGISLPGLSSTPGSTAVAAVGSPSPGSSPQPSLPAASATVPSSPQPTPGQTQVTPGPTATPRPSSRPTASPTPTVTPKPSVRPASSSGTGTASRYALLEACPDRPNCYIYTVRQGDNLRSIVNWFGVSYEAVMRLNPQIVDPARIAKGDRIVIPPPTR